MSDIRELLTNESFYINVFIFTIRLSTAFGYCGVISASTYCYLASSSQINRMLLIVK